MIGDNPATDIKGANEGGWVSILVKTGVFQGEGNDEENPALYVADNFLDSIKLILKLEGICSEGLQ